MSDKKSFMEAKRSFMGAKRSLVGAKRAGMISGAASSRVLACILLDFYWISKGKCERGVT